MEYYFSKIIDLSFENVRERVEEELKKVGFGIVSQIDLQEKFKEKLDVEFGKYMILGACNPHFAYEALKVENKIGTMLPCNFIIRETEDGKTEVAAINPVASMIAVKNNDLSEMSKTVEKKLEKVINSI